MVSPYTYVDDLSVDNLSVDDLPVRSVQVLGAARHWTLAIPYYESKNERNYWLLQHTCSHTSRLSVHQERRQCRVTVGRRSKPKHSRLWQPRVDIITDDLS